MPERFIDEPVNFQVGDKEVSLLFRHLGIYSSNQESKLGINSEVVAELFGALQLLDSNPSLEEHESRVVIDYRPYKEKLIDPPHEVFPGLTVDKPHTLLCMAHANVANLNEDDDRYIYINKFSSVPGIFDASRYIEREFRHELKHLSHTRKFFNETGELAWHIGYYAALVMGVYAPVIYNVLLSQSRSIEQQDALIGIIGGIGLQVAAYHTYRRLSPIENDARKAEKVLRDKTVFQWPETGKRGQPKSR